MQNQSPMVTVLIPSYNQSKYVLQSLRSVFAQTFQNIEIIFLDDCSTDNTKKIVESIEILPNINFISIFNNSNLGLVRNLNQGCRLAKGKYIGLLAADDIWVDNKLEIQVDFMEKNPDVVISAGYRNHIDEFGNVIKEVTKSELIFKSFTFDEIIKNNTLPGSSLLIRSDYLKSINYFDERYYYEDWPLLLKALYDGKKVVKLPYVFVQYRYHSQNLSSVKNIKFKYEQLRIISEYKDYPNFNEIFNLYSEGFLVSISYLHNKMFGLKKMKEIYNSYEIKFFFKFLVSLLLKFRISLRRYLVKFIR